MSLSRRGVSELPHLCHAAGIEHVIISPGSRNAPLIIAFAGNARFTSHSITDERSAGYYGLGMAQQLGKPVALVCTSGTAMVNYAPALAEAFYMRIPLVAITADRPAEWIDQNDGQTIRQKDLYRNVVKGSYEVPVETEKEEDLWLFRRTVVEALTLCRNGISGPVHINVPLREPLYEPLPTVDNPVYMNMIPAGSTSLIGSQWLRLMEKWESYSRKLVICGMGNPEPRLRDHLNMVVAGNEAVVIAENLSNLHIQDAIDTPDRFIASLDDDQKESFHPQLLVTMGGPVLSKKLKYYLRKYKPVEHWHLGEHEPFVDTFQSLTLNLNIDATSFFKALEGHYQRGGNRTYVQDALVWNRNSKASHKKFMEKVPFSDMSAYEVLFKNLPEIAALHLANSTPVRYSQLFEKSSGITYYSNRGTSGIDGCISTAAGAATVSKKHHIVVAGDLAFLYDSNALWNLKFPTNLSIVIMDNGGGNIFRLIDTSPVIDPIRHYFETPHKVDIEKLCNAFSVNYLSASSQQELEDISKDFFKPKCGPCVLHIKTQGDRSAQVFKHYYQFIANPHEH